jgi:hypothetical protein
MGDRIINACAILSPLLVLALIIALCELATLLVPAA